MATTTQERSSTAGSAKPDTDSPLGRRRCTKPGCRGFLEPSVDRNGKSRDECSLCGTLYPVGGGAPASIGASTSLTNGTRMCTVKGCPGRIGSNGGCSCCAKRQAYLEANLPKRSCEVCGGDITSARGGTKYCGACKPIAQKIQIEKHRTANSTHKTKR